MNPSIASIQAAVARFYDIPLREMTSQRRDRPAAHARQVGMYLARELTPYSLPMIGRWFGKRDHTTVIHGIKAVEARLASIDLDGIIALIPVIHTHPSESCASQTLSTAPPTDNCSQLLADSPGSGA